MCGSIFRIRRSAMIRCFFVVFFLNHVLPVTLPPHGRIVVLHPQLDSKVKVMREPQLLVTCGFSVCLRGLYARVNVCLHKRHLNAFKCMNLLCVS